MRGKCPWRRRRREREGSRGEPEGAGPEGRDGGGLVGMAGEPASERGDSGRLTLLPSVCGHPRTLTDTLLAHCCHPCPSLGPAGAALLLLLFPRLCCRSLPPSAPSPALPLLLLLRLPSAGRRTPLTPAAVVSLSASSPPPPPPLARRYSRTRGRPHEARGSPPGEAAALAWAGGDDALGPSESVGRCALRGGASSSAVRCVRV